MVEPLLYSLLYKKTLSYLVDKDLHLLEKEKVKVRTAKKIYQKSTKLTKLILLNE